MAAHIGGDVQQAGLTDMRQVVACRVPHESDVPLATEHVDQLLQNALLLFAPGSTPLKRLDEDAGVVSKRIGKLQLWMDHDRVC